MRAPSARESLADCPTGRGDGKMLSRCERRAPHPAEDPPRSPGRRRARDPSPTQRDRGVARAGAGRRAGEPSQRRLRRRAAAPRRDAAAASSEAGGGARDGSRGVPRAAADVVVRTDPDACPETPRESARPLRARARASRGGRSSSGLSAREPSFHVFVAAEPEVMIEDDIVRYAHALRAARDPPRPTSSTSTTSTTPRRRARSCCPPGLGPALVARDGRAHRAAPGTRSRRSSRATTFKKAQAQLATRARGEEPRGHHQLESLAKTLGFGVRSVHGRRPDVPDPARQARERRAVRRARRVDQARARPRPREAHARGREGGAARARAERGLRGGARGGVLARRRAALIDDAMKRARPTRSRTLGAGRAVSWLERVQQALVEDWDDLVEIDEDEHEQEQRSPRGARRPGARDAPEPLQGEPARLARARARPRPSSTTRTRRTRASSATSSGARASARCSPTSRASAPARCTRRAAACSSCARPICSTDPIIWERMKRVLREQRIGAEDPLGPLGLYATSLRPVPVPIRVRVVLVGPPELYATLLEADADFAALFRVKVEVDPIIPRTPREPASRSTPT